MPELPEVETLCRQLREVVIGGEIQEATVRDAKLGELPALKGSIIRSVARHGKFIHMHLHDGRTLRLHLRMTGRLLWQEDTRNAPTPDYARMTFIFSKGRLDLIDPRRFATVQVIAGAMDDPGPPDPLEDFNIERLRKIAAARTIPIKSFLMDQRVISGIGNIYACEILHAAGIDPAQKAADLSPAQWKRLAGAMAPILQKAVDCRGTTVSDWRDLFGRPGDFQRHIKVYAKAGCACSCRGGTVVRTRLGGRGTYYCPACQTGSA
jgi:formamidopyrimidine-DNA glycosylase